MRERLGLPALDTSTAASAASWRWWHLPAARVPRPLAGGAERHVVGPLIWEPPAADVELPAGDDPLVLIAPSTAQDPEHRLLSAALRGSPTRRCACLPPKPPPASARPARPANARVVDWLSYARTMPHCDVVVCHAGHGTLVARSPAAVPSSPAPPSAT